MPNAKTWISSGSDDDSLSLVTSSHAIDDDREQNRFYPGIVRGLGFDGMAMSMNLCRCTERVDPIEQPLSGLWHGDLGSFLKRTINDHTFPVAEIDELIDLEANFRVLAKNAKLESGRSLSNQMCSRKRIGHGHDVGLLAVDAGQTSDQLAVQQIFHFGSSELTGHNEFKSICASPPIRMTNNNWSIDASPPDV